MTLLAGRMPGLHSLQRGLYGEDNGTQGILKTRRAQNMRSDDSRRLVRFSETPAQSQHQPRDQEDSDVIKFGSNTYLVNNSDPNSAVSKLFPNSKLTPIDPLVNRPVRARSKSDTEDGARAGQKRTIDRRDVRRTLQKVPADRLKPGKNETPLIERIMRLTCEDLEGPYNRKGPIDKTAQDESPKANSRETANYGRYQQSVELNKPTKEGLNLMQYKQNIPQTRRSPTEVKTSPTDEARRSFLSSLSQEKNNEGEAGDRYSVATSSTLTETVYSLSDIEEALTEEDEKEIKEAFANEIRQDELELFVQQGAGRTERLRKRYSSTPRPENHPTNTYCNTNYPLKHASPQFYNSNTLARKDKPKFGSTIEILQQLQQQMESPYQLEGRRTACSNYSDSSMPISERLFYESSDGYEPINTKLIAHRTCSLDSKNYEEIENFPSAFSVPRTKSHEHPKLAYLESDSYICPPNATMFRGNYPGRGQPLEKNVYVSSPDLHGFRGLNAQRQLHPVLQQQYCRYPAHDAAKPSDEAKRQYCRYPAHDAAKSSDEGKVLTPPNRMHTYMNVPSNAPCYSPPPPYSKVQRPYSNPPVSSNIYPFETSHNHSNIYQNLPSPTAHMMTIRRLCTERERGVPEGASSSQDSQEIYHPLKEYFLPSHIGTIPKQSSVPHQYCVDV